MYISVTCYVSLHGRGLSHHETGTRNVPAFCKNVRPSHIAGSPLALLAAFVAFTLLVKENTGSLVVSHIGQLPLLLLEEALLPGLIKGPPYLIASTQLLLVLTQEAG